MWTELKQDIPASSRSANLELARDLASLAAEGGLLVVGVEDNDDRAGEVVGVADANKTAKRITDVGASTVHPPLPLRPIVLLDPADEAGQRGCVLVPIAASPDAPHMADERYWGRGPKGKRRLEDPEVRRYLAERQAQVHSASRSPRPPDGHAVAPSGGVGLGSSTPRGGAAISEPPPL